LRLDLSFSMFFGWVWPEMKKSPEMVWLEMVGHRWVNRRQKGEGEEEEEEKKNTRGKSMREGWGRRRRKKKGKKPGE
jgi:hypothetical protein